MLCNTDILKMEISWSCCATITTFFSEFPLFLANQRHETKNNYKNNDSQKIIKTQIYFNMHNFDDSKSLG